MEQLRIALPPGWTVELKHHNALLCMLPQSRPRVFIIGTSPGMRATKFQARILDRQYPLLPLVRLLDFLDHERKDEDWAGLSLRQQANALAQLQVFREVVEKKGIELEVGIVDIARDPNRGIDADIAFGCTRTLRTNNSHLWVLPTRALEGTFGTYGRFLSTCEKCRVAGIKPESLYGMTSADIETAIGNTIPVALAGVVMYPLFRAWICMQREMAAKEC